MTNQINENEIDIFSVIILFIIFSLMPNRIINTQTITLQWRHNGHDSVSNHQPHDCLLNINSDADQRKHQSSASLAFVRGIHRGPVNSPYKWPVTRSRRNPRSRCAWLTGPEPRSGYARTSFGIDAAAEVTIQSVIYGNPEHSNWHQSFPTHIWLFLAQCGIPAGFIKTMQVEEMQNYKKYINIL